MVFQLMPECLLFNFMFSACKDSNSISNRKIIILLNIYNTNNHVLKHAELHQYVQSGHNSVSEFTSVVCSEQNIV